MSQLPPDRKTGSGTDFRRTRIYDRIFLGGSASRCRYSKASIACATCCSRNGTFCARASGQQRVAVGARGMGKSSLVKALHATVNATHARCKGGDGQLKLIEIHRQDIESLPDLMALMRGAPYRFIVFCDDLSFEAEDTSYKSLKAMLEGGIEGRPDNVVFYATSNRRHLMARDMMENERSTAINPGEAVEEKVS